MATTQGSFTFRTPTSKRLDSSIDKENLTPENMKTLLKLKGNPVSSPFLKSSSGNKKQKTFKILSDEEMQSSSIKGSKESVKGHGKRKSLATLQLSTLGQGALTGQFREQATQKKNQVKDNKKCNQQKNSNKTQSDIEETVILNQYSESNNSEQSVDSDSSKENTDDLVKDAISLMTETAKIDDSYWKSMADERRIALEETLTENEKLYDEIDKLEKENSELKQRLNESECFKVLYNNLLEEIESLREKV